MPRLSKARLRSRQNNERQGRNGLNQQFGASIQSSAAEQLIFAQESSFSEQNDEVDSHCESCANSNEDFEILHENTEFRLLSEQDFSYEILESHVKQSRLKDFNTDIGGAGTSQRMFYSNEAKKRLLIDIILSESQPIAKFFTTSPNSIVASCSLSVIVTSNAAPLTVDLTGGNQLVFFGVEFMMTII